MTNHAAKVKAVIALSNNRNIFSNLFGISGLLESSVTPDLRIFLLLLFLHFKGAICNSQPPVSNEEGAVFPPLSTFSFSPFCYLSYLFNLFPYKFIVGKFTG